jgi:hypothetical protein
MQIVEIPQKNITLYIPADLSECDKVQYIELSTIIFHLQTGQITYFDFRIHAIYKLMNMKPVNQNVEDLEKTSRVFQLSEMIDSFFEPQTFKQIQDNEPRSLKMYYTHNPIPSFIGYFRTYYGPKDSFEDITFGEYIDMLEEFINFNQTNEMIYLHRLLAIGYRPQKLLSKQKVNYSTKKVSKRAKQFQSQPIGIVWGFYLYFASFNAYLSDCKIFVQGNELDLSILFSNSKKDKSNIPGMGMKSVLISIAEAGTYGEMEKVRQTNMWEVFTYMHYVTKKNLDQEREQKSTTP